MSTYATNYLKAIEHLPDGAMLRLEGVSWAEYQQLLEDLTAWRGMRVSYDLGRVEIMSPTLEHEQYIAFFSAVGRSLSEELNVTVEAAGATTYQQERLLKGSEADQSFYVKNPNAIIGKLRIDLDVDPPPDIVVEVDITRRVIEQIPDIRRVPRARDLALRSQTGTHLSHGSQRLLRSRSQPLVSLPDRAVDNRVL
jgi:Uma2 family endonuclease